jgi:transcriptional regulator with XRE-family HTH domain
MFLGDKIRMLREFEEAKQKDKAKQFNVRPNTWSQYESNARTPSIETLKKIAEYYNVSTDYLLGVTDETYNPYEKEFKELISVFSRMTAEEKNKLLSWLKANF